MHTMLGIIGGSGVYDIDGLEGANWVTVKTPWGKPADDLLIGRLHGCPVAFLPRHGRGHVFTPSTVPYRANIDALKQVGVTDIVAVSACGSLRADYAPGDFVLVDQYIDRTFAREKSFFGPGCAAHVSVAHPTCPRLTALCGTAITGAQVHATGTYLAMEGPQFSTLAESRLYRSWGADIIGMTGMPEAKLAREAELCYASVAMITDYDCWNDTHVDVAQVIATLTTNAETARSMVSNLTKTIDKSRTPCSAGCDRSLDHAIMTAPQMRDPDLLARLKTIAGRVL
jgi:5'-methylthioadenosine phosphorylase